MITSLDANTQTLCARVADLRKGPFLACLPTRPPSEDFLTEGEREGDTLAMLAKTMAVELLTCEWALGLSIEGVDPEQLLFRYIIKGGDNSRSAYKASSVLGLSSHSTFKDTLCYLRSLYSRTEESRQY